MDRTERKFRRRDGSGHLDPTYEAMLRAGSGASTRRSDTRAFLGRPWSADPLAEERGGDFVASVTSGQDEAQELLDRTIVEEQGGPFVETSEKTELAYE
jgi:hypothetical protein